MNMLTLAIVAAILATVMSLVFGVSTMASHKAIAHHTGEQWMFLRITFQAIAVVLLVLAFLVR